jgi:hypothetical protein
MLVVSGGVAKWLLVLMGSLFIRLTSDLGQSFGSNSPLNRTAI